MRVFEHSIGLSCAIESVTMCYVRVTAFVMALAVFWDSRYIVCRGSLEFA
jgi:hypothetical protein